MTPKLYRIALSLSLFLASACATTGQEFEQGVKPLLTKYCVECHSGEDASGDVDFTSIKTSADVDSSFELWESVVGHLNERTMPPEEKAQPSDEQRNTIIDWYRHAIENVESRPAVFRPRRLCVTEYRNTLRSMLGFDLQVDVIEAEQTLTERSMVVKLLPIDPPGKSGFKNDTRANPISTVAWDQYGYLADTGLQELFSPQRRTELEKYTGPIEGDDLTQEQAERLLRTFIARAYRRTVAEEDLAKRISRISGKQKTDLIAALKLEMTTVLMSPAFLYRGLMLPGKRGERQNVDSFELAERLSYFLWADMPDQRLMSLATEGTISDPAVYAAEIDRMLASTKSRSLAEDFASQWFTLSEIELVSNNPPQMVALKSQPIDFLHYLFTEDRPLLELIDSKTAFISPHTSRMYGSDAKQMTKYVKQRGIEVEIVPNQKINLEHSTERGGILTMPGVLAMNKGPILRGTWILERILGEPLPEPPADVEPVKPNKPGEDLTFRQRFEQHRSNASCAVCHDKIDPLGFALEVFDAQGQYIRSGNYKLSKKQRKKNAPTPEPTRIDTSGRLPSGESFDDIAGLKRILTTSQREAVTRNMVETTLSYALCRNLELYDRPTTETIVQEMIETNGTWRDLFQAIANSVPFRETLFSKD